MRATSSVHLAHSLDHPSMPCYYMNINHDFRQITYRFLHTKSRVYKIQK